MALQFSLGSLCLYVGGSKKKKKVWLKSTTNNEVREWIGFGYRLDRRNLTWKRNRFSLCSVVTDHFAPLVVRAVGRSVVVLQPSESPNYSC